MARILILHRDEHTANVLRIFLGSRGFQPDLAHEYERALALMKEQPADAAILEAFPSQSPDEVEKAHGLAAFNPDLRVLILQEDDPRYGRLTSVEPPPYSIIPRLVSTFISVPFDFEMLSVYLQDLLQYRKA